MKDTLITAHRKLVELKTAGVCLLRFCSTAQGCFNRHPCGLYAAGLTYFATLAFVPVLCLLMVFAKTERERGLSVQESAEREGVVWVCQRRS